MSTPKRRDGAAPLAATLISIVAFFFCALTSTAFKWHAVITGPLTVACAVALLVSVIWLNRWAGRGDEDKEGPE